MDERKPDQSLVKNSGIYKQKTNQVEFSVNVLVISCRMINQHQIQLITDILSQFLLSGIWTWLSFQFWSSVLHEVVVKLSARAAVIQIWRIYFQFPSYKCGQASVSPWPLARCISFLLWQPLRCLLKCPHTMTVAFPKASEQQERGSGRKLQCRISQLIFSFF